MAVRPQVNAMIALKADLARYRRDPWVKGSLWWLTERTVWAVVAYRVGQQVLTIRPIWLRNKFAFLMSLVATVVEAATGIKLPPTAQIGPGMRIYMGTGLAINAGCVVGRGAVFRQGVTLGAAEVGGTDFPVVGDNVDFGAYAQVFGKVTIGDDARIGSMSVVLKNVPAGVTVFGVPARVMKA